MSRSRTEVSAHSPHMTPPHIIQVAVVGLTHDRVNAPHMPVHRLREGIVKQGIRRRGHTEGIGQDDGRLYVAQLADLAQSGHLAEAVTNEYGRRHLLPEDIAPVRQNGRHAGVHIFSPDDRHLSHPDALHVGDGIIPARRHHADVDAQRRQPRLGKGLVCYET